MDFILFWKPLYELWLTDFSLTFSYANLMAAGYYGSLDTLEFTNLVENSELF